MGGIKFREEIDYDDLREQYTRPGVKSLYKSVCGPSLYHYAPMDNKEQVALEEHMKDSLERDMSLELFKTLKEEGTCSVTINPVTRNDILFAPDDKRIELRQLVYYRKFTVCNKCCHFTREQGSGGYCLKFYIPAHITDGCTFGNSSDDGE